MKHQCYLRVFLVFLGVALLGMLPPGFAAAQSDGAVSLGDLARSLRQSKHPSEPAAPSVIDNDNLLQVIDDVEHFRLAGKPLFSFDTGESNFRMSSPDGTCSLSFNANATSLLATPYVSQDLPQSDLAKLDGPASIHEDTLEVSVYNASAWNVREITVGLTIVRPPDPSAASSGSAKLLPAVERDAVPVEKRSDLTLLIHLKGTTAPLATGVYREKLDINLDQGQDWHWAIVGAKGTPPATVADSLKY
jgi:hypothetical protein